MKRFRQGPRLYLYPYSASEDAEMLANRSRTGDRDILTSTSHYNSWDASGARSMTSSTPSVDDPGEDDVGLSNELESESSGRRSVYYHCFSYESGE